MKPKNPENLCTVPWRGFSNEPDGRARPCCIYKGFITDEAGNDLFMQKDTIEDIFHSPYMQKLREEFRQNKKPIGCDICWKDEESGYRSKRKIYEGYAVDWKEEPEFPIDFHMILSNSCNLKCRSCGAAYSSTWQKENRKHDGDSGFEMPFNQPGDNETVFWKNRHAWYSNLESLEIVGGEPMYIKQWHTVFDELIELGYAKNIHLNMSTNCTIMMPDLIKKIKDNFRQVRIHLSIDGTGKIFEYLRHPAKWDQVYSNMKTYHDLLDGDNFVITITNTVSWLNVLEMSKIHSLVKKEFPKFKIWYNPIHNPKFMSLEHIPEDLKKHIAKQIENYDWEEQASDIEGIKNLMFSHKTNTNHSRYYLKEFDEIDRRRNENIWDVMPNEYLPFLTKYRSPALIATDRDETGDNMT